MSNAFSLPNPSELLKKSKALAMLDAIYCQEWHLRYFSHNAKWSDEEEMGSMRDGQGDDYFILFAPSGVAMKGCFLESGLSGDNRILGSARASIP